MPSLSVITAIHNGLAMNRLFWQVLKSNTTSPFELIIIDNHSTDGSEKFFSEISRKEKNVRYVRNEKNQSYPDSQIQGMQFATAPILCFLNNDIWMPKGWNEKFEAHLKKNPLQVLSPTGQEAQPRQSHSNSLKNRWKRVTWASFLWKKITGCSEEKRLWLSLKWMYGSLEKFKSPTLSLPSFHGIKGDSVVFHRDLLNVLPHPWDPDVEAADWHLYLQVAQLHEKNPKVPLPLVLTDVYIHHFGRYSARQKFEPLHRTFKKIEDLYSPQEIKRLWWGNYLPF